MGWGAWLRPPAIPKTDPKDDLKRLDEHNRTVKIWVDAVNTALQGLKEADAAYKRGQAAISKEVRRWDPDVYEIHASGIDEIRAGSQIDQAVANAREGWRKAELAAFETRKRELIAQYAKGLNVSFESALQISKWDGSWLNDELAKVDAAAAKWDRETPAGLSAAERKDLEERIRREDFGKNGSFELAGGRGMVVHVEVANAVTLQPPKEATVQQTSQSGRHETTKAEDSTSDSKTTYSKTSVSGEFGKSPPGDTGGWGGKIGAGHERGESRTRETTRTGGSESGGQRSNSTTIETKGTVESQSVTLRATVIAPDGSRTTVDMGRVDVTHKRP